VIILTSCILWVVISLLSDSALLQVEANVARVGTSGPSTASASAPAATPVPANVVELISKTRETISAGRKKAVKDAVAAAAKKESIAQYTNNDSRTFKIHNAAVNTLDIHSKKQDTVSEYFFFQFYLLSSPIELASNELDCRKKRKFSSMLHNLSLDFLCCPILFESYH
jgi:hypothetical protein